MPNNPLPSTRPPPRIFAVRCDELDQLWFVTNHQRAMVIARLIARIVPIEYVVQLQSVETDLQRQYISSPQPVLMNHQGKRWQPYNGPISYSTIDTYEGRGQQFTPLEKQKTYHCLKTHITHDYWLLLAPIATFLLLDRTELPPKQAMKKMMKEQNQC